MNASTRFRLAGWRARSAWRQAASARQERQDRREFEDFHRRLPRRDDIVYMFFTSDLLQWVNTFLFSHLQNGDLARVYEKWMGQALPPVPVL